MPVCHLMPASPAGVEHFPVVCVSCAATSGMPYYAKTLPHGGTEVGLRCRECRHEWKIEIEPIVPVVAPKPDRRQHD